MKTLASKKIFVYWLFWLTLIVFIVPVFYQRNFGLAQEENTGSAAKKIVVTCPLEKEVPLGQVVDQTQATSNKILQALKNSGNAALRAMRAAKKTTELIDGCQTENCQSSCQSQGTPVACAGTPTTDCTLGYSCAYQNSFQKGQEIIDNSLSRQDCKSLTNDLSVDDQKVYAVFKWRQDAGFQCEPHSCPDPSFNPGSVNLTDAFLSPAPASNCTSGDTCYYIRAHTGQQILNSCNSGPCWSQMSCLDLPNNLSIDPAATYATYQWSGTHGAGWCNVEWPQTTCYNTCHNEGRCNVDWTCISNTCQGQSCNGNACNFTEINLRQNAVSQANLIVKASYQTIYDTLHKKTASLPLLGNVCEIPGLGILCSLCSVLGNVVNGCQTEPETILALLKRGIINARWCWNDPADYGKIISGEKTGKFLLRCQDLMPSVLEKCYPDNYFCCF